MKQISILLLLSFLNLFSLANPQVTISLITEQGVKKARSLQFYISDKNSTTHKFEFDEFARDGYYYNTNLFQYNDKIDTGLYNINVLFKTDKDQRISDSLLVDNAVARVEIFIFIASGDSVGDFIREVKTLTYQANSDYLEFSFQEKPVVGSKAVFTILNKGDQPLYGYPNNGFFFGTLYEKIGRGSWIQHYPKYIDIHYCDTVVASKPLEVDKSVWAWVPNENDCSEFVFRKKGKYNFQLLYSTSSQFNAARQGLTKISKAVIYSQQFQFEIFSVRQASL